MSNPQHQNSPLSPNTPPKKSSSAPSQQSLTMAHARLQRVQKLYGYAAILVPLWGSLIAMASISYIGFSPLDLFLLVSLYALTIIGITVGFHRQLTHRSFQTHPYIRVLLAILGSAAGQGHTIHWVSNHRRHHQSSDQLGDPHSPHIDRRGNPMKLLRGLWHAQVGWMFDSDFPNVLLAKDLLRDPAIAKVNQMYLIWVILGFAIPATVEGIVTSSWSGVFRGLLWGGFVRVFLVHQAISSVNSVTHLFGQRPFETREQSTNNFWFAFPTFGEAWHNNHHAFQSSAKFGLHWWQFDLGYWVIRTLEVVGLAWDVKTPTENYPKT